MWDVDEAEQSLSSTLSRPLPLVGCLIRAAVYEQQFRDAEALLYMALASVFGVASPRQIVSTFYLRRLLLVMAMLAQRPPRFVPDKAALSVIITGILAESPTLWGTCETNTCCQAGRPVRTIWWWP